MLREMSQPPLDLWIIGAGYVGQALVRAAVAQGWRVGALTRNPATAAALRAAGAADVVEGDCTLPATLAALPPARAVVCTVSSGGGGPEGYRRAYVGTLQAMVDWLGQPAVAAVTQTLLYTGSTSVYPQGGPEAPWVDETAPTGGTGTAPVLLEAEALALELAAIPRRAVLRLAGIYGPGRHHLLDALRSGAPLAGEPAVHLNIIHRDDIATALLAALLVPALPNGVYNLADGAPATRGEVARWLAERFRLPPPIWLDPAAWGEANRLGRRAGPAGNRRIRAERFGALTGWQPRYADYRAGYDAIAVAAQASSPR